MAYPSLTAIGQAVDHAGDGICAVFALRNPISGIVECCARAASGHATAVPPNTVMNLRRFMSLSFETSHRRPKTSTFQAKITSTYAFGRSTVQAVSVGGQRLTSRTLCLRGFVRGNLDDKRLLELAHRIELGAA